MKKLHIAPLDRTGVINIGTAEIVCLVHKDRKGAVRISFSTSAMELQGRMISCVVINEGNGKDIVTATLILEKIRSRDSLYTFLSLDDPPPHYSVSFDLVVQG